MNYYVLYILILFSNGDFLAKHVQEFDKENDCLVQKWKFQEQLSKEETIEHIEGLCIKKTHVDNFDYDNSTPNISWGD